MKDRKEAKNSSQLLVFSLMNHMNSSMQLRPRNVPKCIILCLQIPFFFRQHKYLSTRHCVRSYMKFSMWRSRKYPNLRGPKVLSPMSNEQDLTSTTPQIGACRIIDHTSFTTPWPL